MKTLKVLSILLILGLVSFGNSLSNPFVHDDVIFILQNSTITHPKNLSAYFFPFDPSVSAASIVNAPYYYRPLLDIFYIVEYGIFGQNPFGYHLFNILIHIMNAFLAFLILNLLAVNRKIAFGTVVLFLIHPTRVGSVTGIVGISDLIFSLFCLGSFLCYLYSARKQGHRLGLGLYSLSLVLFLLALLAKEQAFIFPLLIVLYEFCFLSKSNTSIPGRLIRMSGPWVILLNYMFFRSLVLGRALPELFAYKNELVLRILSIPGIILDHLGFLFFPVNLSFYHVTDILEAPLVPFLGLFVCVAAVLLIVRSADRANRTILIFSLGWFVIAFLPAFNIVPIVLEYSFIWTPEHFLYLPALGFFLFISVVIKNYSDRLFKARSAVIATVTFIMVCLVLIGATIKYNTYFRGEVPLFERVVKVEKRIGRFHMWLAKAYYLDQQINKATKEYITAGNIENGYLQKVKAKEVRDFYLSLIGEIHQGLANCYEAQNDFINAIKEYHEALAISPQDGRLNNNLGLNYLKLGRVDEAMIDFHRSVMLNEKNTDALNNLAFCYIQKGNFFEAESLLRRALSVDKDSIPARKNLEKLLAEKIVK